MQKIETILKVVPPDVVVERPVSGGAGGAEAVAVSAGLGVPALDVGIVMHDRIFFDAADKLGDGVVHGEAAGDRDICEEPGAIVHVDSGQRHSANMQVVSDHSQHQWLRRCPESRVRG